MNSTTVAASTAVLVVGGRWYAGKPIDVKIAVGAGVYIIGLAFISSVDSQFALRFSYLALLAAGYDFANNVGWTGRGAARSKKVQA